MSRILKPIFIGLRPARILAAAALLAVALGLLAGTGTASADRWGPPWQGRVATDGTVVRTRPDPAAPVVGPLGRGAIVVVLEEKVGADGDSWLRIPDGYLPSGDVQESFTPWTAELSAPAASIYAKPFTASGVRRTVRQGDLLRVTGVSAGLEGDTGVWWSTTEGYLPLGTLRWATGDWAGWWQLPDASEAPNGWWGTIVSRANVRAAPSTRSPIVGVFSGGERVKVLAEEQGQAVDGDPVWYRIDGGRYAGARVHSSLVARLPDPQPNVTPPPGGGASGSWIVVDRARSTLTFVEAGKPRFTTYVSLGLAGVATPEGSYVTFGKFLGDRMSSRNVENAARPYDLPNVPFTQYYKDGGYAIHGTYWHDLFGSRESQGCINLTWADSAYLFELTEPSLADGDVVAWAARLGGDATQVVILN